jgi:hypothetical protein
MRHTSPPEVAGLINVSSGDRRTGPSLGGFGRAITA